MRHSQSHPAVSKKRGTLVPTYVRITHPRVPIGKTLEFLDKFLILRQLNKLFRSRHHKIHLVRTQGLQCRYLIGNNSKYNFFQLRLSAPVVFIPSQNNFTPNVPFLK